MFRGLGSSRARGIDPWFQAPYVATCPKQSNGKVAAGAHREGSAGPGGGKLLGADRRRGSGGAGSPAVRDGVGPGGCLGH